MKSTGAFALCLLAVLVATTGVVAKPQKLDPPDRARGVIGVRIKILPPSKAGYYMADAVYFVRIVDDGDRFAAESVIPSNYSKGNSVYLLNARPGRYVAVACQFERPMAPAPSLLVFPKQNILRTEVEVAPGAVVLMGDILTDSVASTSEADEAETHYLALFDPAAAKHGWFHGGTNPDVRYVAWFGSVDQRESTAKSFWAEAVEKHFKSEEAWRKFLAK